MSFILCIMFILGGVTLKIYLVQQPFLPKDIPKWEVQELSTYKWKLKSLDYPERNTTVWIKSPENMKCDTLIIIAGVEEGENLLSGRGKWKYSGNTLLMKQPVHTFLKRNSWKEWDIMDWWNIPEILRKETEHTLGALNALLNYVKSGKTNGNRFTDKVVMAGGSVGAPIPVILSSFYPTKVDGLMVIYGFTNFRYVISSLLFNQSLNHYNLNEKSTDIISKAKIAGITIITNSLGFVFANILKYGQMELYLPNISNTPIYFINGMDDPLVPTQAYLPLWENASEPKSETWLEGGHFNPNNPEDMLRTGKLMYEWTNSHGLRSCSKIEK